MLSRGHIPPQGRQYMVYELDLERKKVLCREVMSFTIPRH